MTSRYISIRNVFFAQKISNITKMISVILYKRYIFKNKIDKFLWIWVRILKWSKATKKNDNGLSQYGGLPSCRMRGRLEHFAGEPFLLAPPSSSQAAKVKETLKNLDWIGNLTRLNWRFFSSPKYRSDNLSDFCRKYSAWANKCATYKVNFSCEDVKNFVTREKIAVEWKSLHFDSKSRDLNLSTFTPD